MNIISLSISVLALLVSAVTAWFSLFHKGKVAITTPHFFALVPEDGKIKFFMRLFMFSTGKRGNVVESMFLKVTTKKRTYRLLFWLHGHLAKNEIGGGIHVEQNGVKANHHFLNFHNDEQCPFTAGKYSVSVFASLLGSKRQRLLREISFSLDQKEAAAINSRQAAIYFIWDPEKQTYESKIEHPEDRPTEVPYVGVFPQIDYW